MKITNYKVIEHSDIKVVAMAVRTELPKGWQPYGEIVKDGGRLYQAMVKYEEESRSAAISLKKQINSLNYEGDKYRP